MKRALAAIRAAQREHAYVVCHSDGDIRPIMDDLVEIGVDILNPIQPECMPLDEVMAQHETQD